MKAPRIQMETHGKLEFRRSEQFAWDGSSEDTGQRLIAIWSSSAPESLIGNRQSYYVATWGVGGVSGRKVARPMGHCDKALSGTKL